MKGDTGRPKNGGGRPARWPPEYIEALGAFHPEVKGNRRLIDEANIRSAFESLYPAARAGNEAAAWAIELQEGGARHGDFRRRTLLVELGYWPPEKRVELAEAACKEHAEGDMIPEIEEKLRRLRAFKDGWTWRPLLADSSRS